MPGLGIGVTRASFHSFGNLPDLIVEEFCDSRGNAPTVSLSILADIPSGPFDFVISTLGMRLNTSTSVHNSSSGQIND